MAGIRIDGVEKKFGQATALARIDLDIPDGEFLALLGPSGCGKTTLLRIIAGLETATAGQVFIGDRNVTELQPRQRGIAMVFQNYAVFPHMTVFENVAFGLRMRGAEDAEVKAQVARAAELLHITPYLDRYPAKLSGGQRQRVAVARALAVRPSVLLMDEPLSNLDALLRLEMRTELKAVLAQSGATTIYVTHDQTEAMGLADRIAVMHKGVIEQIDRPQALYERPATRFVGGFLGSPPMNFLDLPVRAGVVELDGFRAAAPGTDRIIAGVRAEDVEIADSGLPFDVRVAEPLGAMLLLSGAVAGQTMRVAARPDMLISAGQRLYLRPDPARIVWIDPATERAVRAAA
ncbi:MAG: ABC transporter ATP-binding protein [Methylobacteriaceae bacterium]|nr:ABC transporter ATP-binding protein [Methylobacteriaceae bacterium]